MLQIGDLLAQITGEPSPTSTDVKMTLPPKRKPDEQMRRPVDKLQRTGSSTTSSARPSPSNDRPSAVDVRMDKMKLAPNGNKPKVGASPTGTTFAGGRPTPPPTSAPSAPKAPPKKGSFAEIMARGKQAQSVMGQVGKISHQTIAKPPSKRDREDMKLKKSSNLQTNIGPNGKFRAAGQEALKDARGGKDVRNGSVAREGNGKLSKKAAEPVPEKKIKKSALATTGYSGTARPKPGGARGPSKPSASGSSSRYDRGPDRDRHRDDRRGSSGARYAYVSDDEEEDEEEQDDYESDESDMEAAAFEVDEEEELATRIARKEDAEALAEENRLKREKEEKRKRLAAMAKTRERRY